MTPALFALVLAAGLAVLVLVLVLRAVVRHRRGPPPLSRVLLAGSLYEANLPRPRRDRD